MDTSIHVTCGMMWEWEAMALGEQSDAQTVRAPRARSSGGEYPDHNRLPTAVQQHQRTHWCPNAVMQQHDNAVYHNNHLGQMGTMPQSSPTWQFQGPETPSAKL